MDGVPACCSQRELHAVRGDFEAGVADGAMLVGSLIEDRIGVVDVYENLARGGVARKLCEQAVASGEREVAHFTGGFLAAAGREEFVIGPEGAVEEGDVAGGGRFEPLARDVGKRGSEKEGLGALFETERDDRFFGREGAAEVAAEEVGKAAPDRNRRAEEGGRGGRIFTEAAGKAAAGTERLPLNGRFGPVENVEDAIFGLHDLLDGRRGEEEKRLEFAEMKQAHESVDVGRGQEDAAEWSSRRVARRRIELPRGGDLRAEVGRGSEQEPDDAVRGECELGLRAGGGADGAGAQTGAVRAGAIPLREAAAGRRAEDFDLHRRKRS